MPDITMCASERCPRKERCYRSPASGTKAGVYQSWFMIEPDVDDCVMFWEVKRRSKDGVRTGSEFRQKR